MHLMRDIGVPVSLADAATQCEECTADAAVNFAQTRTTAVEHAMRSQTDPKQALILPLPSMKDPIPELQAAVLASQLSPLERGIASLPAGPLRNALTNTKTKTPCEPYHPV
jgi:hypothetical protein